MTWQAPAGLGAAQGDEELRMLWRRYKAHNDSLARDRLILTYAPLVKYVAGRMSSALPSHVEETDLISYGLLGLIGAVKGAELLKSTGLGGIPLMLGFVVLSAGVNMLMGSASAKWAVMAPVFVPMLMLLGYTPELAAIEATRCLQCAHPRCVAGCPVGARIDGFIARHFNQVSNLGKILDPVADRLLFILGVGGIVVDGAVPAWFAVAVLVREGLVGGATITLGLLGVRRIDVTWFGKAYTLLLMLAFPLFLASHSTLGWADGARTAAWIVGIPGLVLSYWSAVLYVPMARNALRDRDLTPEVVA